MEVISSMGYAGIVALMFVENIFPPIPSELIVPLAGFLVSQGQFTFLGVVIAGTLGSTLGALPLYYVGKTIEEKRLRLWLRKYGRWIAMAERDVDRANFWFDKYGGWTVFFCRLIPGIRSLISLPAGIQRMNLFPFLLWSAAGMAVWTTVLTAAGYLLRHNFEKVEDYLDPFVYAIIGIIIIGYIYRVGKRQNNSQELAAENGAAD
jgi:membrane protein DedA with SNARE-associated domain